MSSSETGSDGEPKKKRTRNPAKYKRNVIKNSKGQQTDKVKKAFNSLYGITEARVRRLCDLLNEGKSPIGKRGCHPKANTVPPEISQKIHEHIFCFPRKKAYYAGKDIDAFNV
ncbi:hypothetical protein HHI36_010132 [Cryptolaemus montrouzieri]|uniref:Uncharacterized protein n=1 Tax=Cryptolaemus montrouzieri TaxID=559131 RepID=A0ABD2MHW0_9CUCU